MKLDEKNTSNEKNRIRIPSPRRERALSHADMAAVRQKSCLFLLNTLICFHYIKLFLYDGTASTEACLHLHSDQGTLGENMVRTGKKDVKGGILCGSRQDSGPQLIFKRERVSPSSCSERQQACLFRGRFQAVCPKQTSTSPGVSGKVPNVSYVSVFHLCARFLPSCSGIQSQFEIPNFLYRPHRGIPTTHILKSTLGALRGVLFKSLFCLPKLACSLHFINYAYPFLDFTHLYLPHLNSH